MLQDTWTYRFHDPESSDWTLSSYVRLADISSVHDMWDVHQSLPKYLAMGMFFAMREHVFPCWDDPANINGSCLSMKVLKTELPLFWETLVIRMMSESLVMDSKHRNCDESALEVNGISTSPKHQYSIVKIWLAGNVTCRGDHFHLPTNYHGDVIYKSNSSLMQQVVKSGVTNRV